MLPSPDTARTLPRHDVIGPGQRSFGLACIVAAGALLAAHVMRLAMTPDLLGGRLPVVVAIGILSADLASGLVHWTADTWGSETLPFIGRRFLRPFRVHHVNPDDFLRRSFIDTNADVSMFLVPVLIAAQWISLETESGVLAAAYVMSFAAASWPTNQIHQWAHRLNPPRWIARLQDRGILLSPAAHDAHHRPPHATHYCIALGWLNHPLAWVGFFPALERLVTAVTGMPPRQDDASFGVRAGAPPSLERSA